MYGAGAVGSLVGALLHDHGVPVRLIARAAHAQAVRTRGLELRGPHGARLVPLPAATSLEGSADLVLLTVKSQDVPAASRDIVRTSLSALVVTMQNGIRSDLEAAEILGRDRVVGCVLYVSATYLEPGIIEHAEFGKLQLGAPFPEAGDRVEPVRALLGAAMRTQWVPDIARARWTKLIGNLNNAIMAITGLPVSRALAHPRLGRLSIAAMREGIRTARAAGHDLDDSPRARRFRLIAALPVSIGYLLSRPELRRQFPPSSSFGGSTQQSVLRGSSSELDYLNGEIVRAGERAGRATPINAALLERGRDVFQTRRFLRPEELLAGLRL